MRSVGNIHTDIKIEYAGKNNLYFQIIFYYFPWISVLFLIFSLSSQPAANLPRVENIYLDKIAHIVEYFILGLCTLRVFGLWTESLRSPRSSDKNVLYLILFFFVLLFGFGDELHQTSVEGRTFDLIDLTMDGVGVLLVIILHSRFAHRLPLL